MHRGEEVARLSDWLFGLREHGGDHDASVIRLVTGNPRSAAGDEFEESTIILIEDHICRGVLVIVGLDICNDEMQGRTSEIRDVDIISDGYVCKMLEHSSQSKAVVYVAVKYRTSSLSRDCPGRVPADVREIARRAECAILFYDELLYSCFDVETGNAELYRV